MKRVLVVLVLSLVLVFAIAGAASAATDWFTAGTNLTHTGFGVDTGSCAACHVTHSANVAYLLKGTGTTQTAFCYICHDGVGSPYDVEDGRIQKFDAATNNDFANSDAIPSPAGGFGFTANKGAGTDYVATSKHNVQTVTVESAEYNNRNLIPGGSTYDTTGGVKFGNFRCGSCHDPHGSNTNNKRLLRKTIFGSTVNDVVINVDRYGAGPYASEAYRTKNYGTTQLNAQSINNWCGLCHDMFNVGNDAGKSIVDAAKQNGHYRHPVGINVPDAITDQDVVTGTPVSGAAISCLTCHRAHGTNATMTHVATGSWENDAGQTKSGSALLRRNERGVCYNCHGGAEKNLENAADTP